MEKWAIGVAKKDMEIVAVNTSKETIMETAQQYQDIPRSTATVCIFTADFDEQNQRTDHRMRLYEIIN